MGILRFVLEPSTTVSRNSKADAMVGVRRAVIRQVCRGGAKHYTHPAAMLQLALGSRYPLEPHTDRTVWRK
jgi:hypothetical protein